MKRTQRSQSCNFKSTLHAASYISSKMYIMQIRLCIFYTKKIYFKRVYMNSKRKNIDLKQLLNYKSKTASFLAPLKGYAVINPFLGTWNCKGS